LIINSNNKLAEIIRTIKEIDKQHNGFVTTTELDDILKMYYKEDLGDKDLRQIMKKYASIQNRVLVDYKLFRDSIV
jgi:Ca2+-binding EF-hand superfamily protein